MNESEARGRVLVVDDEESMRLFLRRTLRREGYDVVCAVDGDEATLRLEEDAFDLVVTDLSMPGKSGMELLRWTRAERRQLPVIVMTGYASIPSAIEALKGGAEDYITKPFDREEILKSVGSALDGSRLRSENRLLKSLLQDGRRFEGLVGSSPPMRELYRLIDQVAPREGVVLITGESGTGKELVARAVHARSPRRDRPFVAFHAASVPAGLVAAELFGAVPGAFTGAKREREGAVGRASGGVLFLDEIGEIPLDVQPALLRLLESGESTALGASESRRFDLRIVAATHRDLAELVAQGLFRQDLFYRLNVFTLDIPPLRRRRSDIADLVRHFLARHGGDDLELELEASILLEAAPWPGNVRELEHVVERLVAMADSKVLGAAALPEEIRRGSEPGQLDLDAEGDPPLKEALQSFERRYLERLMVRTQGNVSEAARRAGVSRPTLHAKLTQYRIDPARHR